MGVLPRNPRSIPEPSTLILDDHQTSEWTMHKVSAAASIVAHIFEDRVSLYEVLFPLQEYQKESEGYESIWDSSFKIAIRKEGAREGSRDA